MGRDLSVSIDFFFNDTATTEIYTLSLHDALPISELVVAVDAHVPAVGEPQAVRVDVVDDALVLGVDHERLGAAPRLDVARSEEHTSELQSRQYLVCRLLLEKKNSTDLWSRSPVTT